MTALPLRRRSRLLGAIAACVALLGGPFLGVGSAGAATAINGGGSGFAGLEIQQWQADTARQPYNLSVNYSSQGSSVGRANFGNGLYDYGVSDIPFQPGEAPQTRQRCGARAAADCFRYVPISSGGLSFMYNLVIGANRVTSLKLTPDQVCGIFTQTPGYRVWGDLASNNPALAGLTGPDNSIVAVTRNEGAGESYVLSEYCIATSPRIWAQFVDYEKSRPIPYTGGPTSGWPPELETNINQVQLGGADGVADHVADPTQGKNSITYDAAGYALVRRIPVASVLNAAGKYQQPDEINVTVALQYATGRGDGTFILDFRGPDPRAYFPSTYSYALAQTAGFDLGKGATLSQFLCYAIGKGQVIAPRLRYARLSPQIVAISANAISAIPGAPPIDTCTAGAPPPPEAPQVVGGPGSGTTGPGGPGSTGPDAAGGGSSTAAAAAVAAAAAAATTTTLSPTQIEAEQALKDAQKKTGGQDISAADPAKSSGTSNADAMWYLFLGAVVCFIGVGVTSGRRASP